jgi:hypothetical protein
MSKGIGTVVCFLALAGLALAQNDPSPLSWQEIRDHQPASLHLKISLTKTEYAQGERIEAKLDYTNDDPKTTYLLAVGGEGPGGLFCAEDAKGHRVVDPGEWERASIVMMGGGLYVNYPLGSHSITLPVNNNVRFDRPGTYNLYAEAELTPEPFRPPSIWIVSDKIPIKIVPLSRARQKQMIAEALGKIGTTDSLEAPGVRDGFAELNYLQTPAAREAEMPFLAKPRLAWMAGYGFLSAIDPAKESARILNAVKSGKLILGEEGIYTYGEAKAFSVPHRSTIGLPDKEERAQFKRVYKAEEEARNEMVTALVTASGHSGPSQARVLWTAFEMTASHGSPRMPDPDGGAARAAIAKHQLELSPEEVHQLFMNWTYWSSDDFLPLVRREATASDADPAALLILADADPAAARPLVLKEFNSGGNPSFLVDDSTFPPANRNFNYPPADLFLAVKPMPLPEVDSMLRTILANSHDKLGPVLPVIRVFGSPNLLPDVLAAFHQYSKNWNEEWAKFLLSYAFRTDPKQATEAFEHEIETQNASGELLINQLFNVWNDKAQPFVLWALQQSDPKLVLAAVTDLQFHGDATTIDPMIGALERLGTSKESVQQVADFARWLLKEHRTPYSDAQKKRLDALAGLAPAKSR